MKRGKINRQLLCPAILLLCCLLTAKAQIQEFIPVDETMQQLINFYQTDTIIVITPKGYELLPEDKTSIQKFAFWMKDIAACLIPN